TTSKNTKPPLPVTIEELQNQLTTLDPELQLQLPIKAYIDIETTLDKNQQQQKQTIYNNIIRRQKNFTDHTTRMIDSILKKKHQHIQSINIVASSAVITEPTAIKAETSKHFES
ncbi:18244_t:CDS:2, partial [Racocetra persica]